MRIVKNLKRWIINDDIVALYNSNSFSPVFLEANQANIIYENRGKRIEVEDEEFKSFLKDHFISMPSILNSKKFIQLKYKKKLGKSTKLNIRFMASYECNQNCEYCMTRFIQKQMAGHFDLKYLDNLIPTITNIFKYSPFKKIDGVNVKLIGGEPTMPKAWEINKIFLKIINDNYINCEHMIVTNGDYISESLVSEFKELNIKSVYLSFDIRQQKNEQNGSIYRNEFEKFVKKCELIEKCGLSIKIDFKCDKDTIIDEKIVNFIKDRLSINPNSVIINSPIIDQSKYDALISPQCDKYDVLLKKDNGIFELSKRFYDLNPKHGSWPNEISAMVYRCNASTLTNICIYPNGLITGCGKLYSSNINKVPIVANLQTGKVNKKTLLSFKTNVLKDKECKKCEYTFICGGKCPLKKDSPCDKEKKGIELLMEAYKYTINKLSKKG